jgi:polar amino acid transport system permease protein
MADPRPWKPPAPSKDRLPRALLLAASVVALWFILQALLGGQGVDLDELRSAAPLLAHGLGLTVMITSVSVTLGGFLAAALCLGLSARSGALRGACRAWCMAFRGTPLVAQLYLVYYGAGEIHDLLSAIHIWWLFREPLACVLITFTLNTGAYQARILHGALMNLPREQTDAALALGLPRRVTLLRVLLPQALLSALRPLGNELTKMTKSSAIASLVTVLDLLGTVKYLFSQTLDFGFYILAAILYILLVGAIRMALDRIERRLSQHLGAALTA